MNRVTLELWWTERGQKQRHGLRRGYSRVRLDRAQPPTTQTLHRVLAGLKALA